MGMSRSGATERGKGGYWAYSDTGLSAIWIEDAPKEQNMTTKKPERNPNRKLPNKEK